jgi:hypothetical protein
VATFALHALALSALARRKRLSVNAMRVGLAGVHRGGHPLGPHLRRAACAHGRCAGGHNLAAHAIALPHLQGEVRLKGDEKPVAVFGAQG